MVGIGPTELVTVLVFLFSSGGLMGLPLSVPPLPPDPMIERLAPADCLFHMEAAGLAAPAVTATNLTERMLADPEMREFLGRVAQQVVAVARQAAPVGPDGVDAVATLVDAAPGPDR
ncbi:MAG: hypothetical protein ACKO1M_16660 [Planctomycetota bacterium]